MADDIQTTLSRTTRSVVYVSVGTGSRIMRFKRDLRPCIAQRSERPLARAIRSRVIITTIRAAFIPHLLLSFGSTAYYYNEHAAAPPIKDHVDYRDACFSKETYAPADRSGLGLNLPVFTLRCTTQ